MSRGRLMNIMSASFAYLDPLLTVYDADYTVPVGARAEITVTLPCQVEEPTWFRATFKQQGLQEDGEVTLILHYQDLETLGLLDLDHKPLINIGTRLTSLNTAAGVVLTNFTDPPGMYVIQARDSSFGLSIDNNPTRNLLFLLLAPRPKAV
jgi:hypothetical protein